MHKRVLVAEPADTIRSVAESVLRQNGFEVISVISAEKALEVLQYTTPDVLILGADLQGPDGRPLYERIQDNPKTSSLPLLLFDSSESEGLPFPDEVIIPRPFDPKDFIQRVQVFCGQAGDHSQVVGQGGPGAMDEDFLDQALGVDNLQVTESEVMNQTNTTIKTRKATVEKMVGMDHVVEHDDDLEESGKVESLMIRDDDTLSGKRTPPAETPPPVKPGTGKIELNDDQYGIADPSALEAEDPDPDHDYNWFINSMRDEVTADKGPAKPAEPTAGGDDLAIEKPSAAVDPVTPPPATVSGSAAQSAPAASTTKPAKKSAGVEKFIDEFREEMERIRADNEPEMVSVKADSPGADGEAERSLSWEEKLENITPEHLSVFTRQLAAEFGRSLAEKIMTGIDTEQLLKHIAREVADRFVKEQKK